MLILRRWIAQRGFVMSACVAMIVLADWFFYEQVIGWTVALFAATLLAVIELRTPRLWSTAAGKIMMVLAALLLLAFLEQPTALGILLMLLGIATLSVLAQERWTSSITQWIGRWALLGISIWLQWLLDNILMSRWFRRHPSARPATTRAAMRWVIPVALGSIFIFLFAVANPIIARWLRSIWENIWALLDWIPLVLVAGRVFMWFVVGVVVYGLLRYRRIRWLPHLPVISTVPILPLAKPTSRAEWIVRCLLVFNAVFAVQTVFDILYLWGGAALPHGMTYAEYAHRGAYPLVATALLAGAFVLMTFRSGGAAHRNPTARRLVFVWIAQNLFLLASTIWRLWLYVDVYSLTRLRLAAMIWVLLVAMGFGWIVLKIVAARTNIWLWRTNVATLLAVLYIVSFLNYDGLIANFNIRHCREVGANGPPLDIAYLRDLGIESLPALDEVRPNMSIKKHMELDSAVLDLRSELSEDLANWRGWTWRRARIADADNSSKVTVAFAPDH